MRRTLLGVAALVVLAGIVIGARLWLRHRFPPPPNYSFGTGLHLQSGTSGNDSIALGDARGRALVVWSNHDGKASSDMHWEHGVLILSGQVAAADGPVPFRCEVPDTRTGTLALDGNTYDLARGTVFLISPASHPPRVTQLDADVTRLQPGATNESVVAALKKDPRIQAFFAPNAAATLPAIPATHPRE
jgi:hypothetical protein